jgi:glycosidase
MRVNDHYADPWNVSAQLTDEKSILSFWKQALAIRKKHEVLVSPVNLIVRNAVVTELYRYMGISVSYLSMTCKFLRTLEPWATFLL